LELYVYTFNIETTCRGIENTFLHPALLLSTVAYSGLLTTKKHACSLCMDGEEFWLFVTKTGRTGNL